MTNLLETGKSVGAFAESVDDRLGRRPVALGDGALKRRFLFGELLEYPYLLFKDILQRSRPCNFHWFYSSSYFRRSGPGLDLRHALHQSPLDANLQQCPLPFL
jgi:hypothetical protein